MSLFFPSSFLTVPALFPSLQRQTIQVWRPTPAHELPAVSLPRSRPLLSLWCDCWLPSRWALSRRRGLLWQLHAQHCWYITAPKLITARILVSMFCFFCLLFQSTLVLPCKGLSRDKCCKLALATSTVTPVWVHSSWLSLPNQLQWCNNNDNNNKNSHTNSQV